MNANDVLIKPVVTEKATLLAEKNKYVFKVSKKSNKKQIKSAIKEIYNVDAENVNIINVRSKRKGVRFRFKGFTPAWKKAIVTVKKGDKLDIFEIK